MAFIDDDKDFKPVDERPVTGPRRGAIVPERPGNNATAIAAFGGGMYEGAASLGEGVRQYANMSALSPDWFSPLDSLQRLFGKTPESAAKNLAQITEDKAARAEINAPLKAAHPLLFSMGETAPQMLAPAGGPKVLGQAAFQGGLGATLGAIRNPDEPGAHAAQEGFVGGLGGLAGGWLGNLAGSAGKAALGKEVVSPRMQAARDAGITAPLSVMQTLPREGRGFGLGDYVESTLANSLGGGALRRQHRALADNIMERATSLTGAPGTATLTADMAAKRVEDAGALLTRAVATMGNNQIVVPKSAFDAMKVAQQEIAPSQRSSEVTRYIDKMLGEFSSGNAKVTSLKMTPKQYQATISKIEQSIRAAGDDTAMVSSLEQTRNILDQARRNSVPGLASDAYDKARQSVAIAHALRNQAKGTDARGELSAFQLGQAAREFTSDTSPLRATTDVARDLMRGPPDSGTAARQMANNVTTLGVPAAAGGMLATLGMPALPAAAAAMAAPVGMSKFMASPFGGQMALRMGMPTNPAAAALGGWLGQSQYQQMQREP